MAKTHKLKTWKQYYRDVYRRMKKFEVRKDDRDFQVGDILILQEYDQLREELTGNEMHKKVTYKLIGGQWGIEEGFCVLGIKDHYPIQIDKP